MSFWVDKLSVREREEREREKKKREEKKNERTYTNKLQRCPKCIYSSDLSFHDLKAITRVVLKKKNYSKSNRPLMFLIVPG